MKKSAIVLFALAVGILSACSRPPALSSDVELTMNPSGHAPLAGVLHFSTDQPSRVSLTISDDENTSTVTPSDTFDTDHEVMVLGLRPDRQHTIDVVFENESGMAGETVQKEVTTDALPDYLPPIDVVLSRPARMEPGYTFIPLSQFIPDLEDENEDTEAGTAAAEGETTEDEPATAATDDKGEDEEEEERHALIAVDAKGDIVWAYVSDFDPDEPRRLPNGNILFEDFEHGAFEIDMLGNLVNRWHATETAVPLPEGAIPVAMNNYHHDLVVMPSGNFLALSTEAREFESWHASEEDFDTPWEPATVIGDTLVEYQPDGKIVREWKFFDLLDPERIGYDSLDTGFYEEQYELVLEEPGYDWSHSNAVVYLPDEDAALISVKHMAAVLKLNLGTSELEWIMGTPDGWREPWSDLLLEPVGDLTWFWHQHAPEILPNGNIMLFDNGSVRTLPPAERAPVEDRYSRVVEYRIDEENRTVEEIWSYGEPGEDSFYSGFVCEADKMPETGNLLVTVGGQVKKEDGTRGVSPVDGRVWPMIMEVTHDTPAERVWQVVVDDPEMSWIVYRSERMPSLYP